jgi:hypothetical protein
MKKSQLRQLILEELKGYSKYAPGGITKGGTTADFTTILTNLVKGDDQVTRGNKSIDKGDPQKGNDILDRGNPNIPLDEENKLEKYVVFFYTNDDDHDWDVMATSEEDAIQKVKSGEVKGPYGQSLPRLARKFSAKKLG